MKRLIPVLLAMAMLLSLMSVTAFATTSDPIEISYDALTDTITSTGGEGIAWYRAQAPSKIVLNSGYTFKLVGEGAMKNVENHGTIISSTWNCNYQNYGGTMTGLSTSDVNWVKNYSGTLSNSNVTYLHNSGYVENTTVTSHLTTNTTADNYDGIDVSGCNIKIEAGSFVVPEGQSVLSVNMYSGVVINRGYIDMLQMPEEMCTAINYGVVNNSTNTTKVDFDFYGNSSYVVQEFFSANGKAVAPEPPATEGYCFSGWYNGDRVYDFSSTVTEPMTLTGKWVPTSMDESTEGDEMGTNLNYTIPSSYTVSIPATVTMGQSATVSVSNVLIQPDKMLKVTVYAQEVMVNENGDKLFYQIKNGDKNVMNYLDILRVAGGNASATLDFTLESNQTEKPGVYSEIITFNASIVGKYQDEY